MKLNEVEYVEYMIKSIEELSECLSYVIANQANWGLNGMMGF